ncbi:hypothetical protein BU23DRAFT_42482 [Bimuria novae-zelandiae CBS 107.79]|uniref:Uncharacterized protein n=1 Tax=Bimuria novae-zelandiae CBS 107.79 TaxID=1447943 RepID=A0A6A5VME3_9PLEO|nr:hypothetical protein BU23DRAFT_42482 [Bimuria novae-zelandiae CBS 107.79]
MSLGRRHRSRTRQASETRASPRMKLPTAVVFRPAERMLTEVRASTEQRRDALQKRKPVERLADRQWRSITVAAGPHASSSPAISPSDIGDFVQVRSFKTSLSSFLSLPPLPPPGAKPHPVVRYLVPQTRPGSISHALPRPPALLLYCGRRRGALAFFSFASFRLMLYTPHVAVPALTSSSPSSRHHSPFLALPSPPLAPLD